jgi:hypothetical protein
MAPVVILVIFGVAVLIALLLLATDFEGGGGSDQADRSSHGPHVGK